MRKLLSVAVSMLVVQAVAAPTTTAAAPVRAAGNYTISKVLSVEFVPRGQQCLVLVEDVITFTGDLTGTSTTVGPAEARFFATCDDLAAAGGDAIPSVFHDVEHLVLNDGTDATLISVGRTDANGNFEGTTVLRGGLHGVLHTTGLAGQAGTYEGLVVKG